MAALHLGRWPAPRFRGAEGHRPHGYRPVRTAFALQPHARRTVPAQVHTAPKPAPYNEINTAFRPFLYRMIPLPRTVPKGIISVARGPLIDRYGQAVYLKTLGHPSLRRADGIVVGALRRKDLALLVFLCVERRHAHARGRLAALLWGESQEELARHSLTQALGRLARALPHGVVTPDKDTVRWSGGVDCDAETLLRGELRPEEVDDALSLYPAHFLEGFDAGPGAEDFHDWADRRRAELRNAALHLLERAGEHAESAGAWTRALRLGERAVEIDPVWEQGHRRVMRALAARGERNAALRHYQRFEAWLAEEVGGDPDPDTRSLAGQLRAL